MVVGFTNEQTERSMTARSLQPIAFGLRRGGRKWTWLRYADQRAPRWLEVGRAVMLVTCRAGIEAAQGTWDLWIGPLNACRRRGRDGCRLHAESPARPAGHGMQLAPSFGLW